MRNIAVAIAMASLVATTSTAHAEHAAPPSIQVTGHAELSAAPDVAEFTVTIVSKSRDAVAASNDTTQRSDAVIAALRKFVSGAGAVRTEGFAVSPEYRWDRGEQILVGYRAFNRIGVELADLARVGGATAAALDAGADTIADLRFSLKDDTELRARALAMAANRARQKADAIAESLGLRVVRVLSAVEAGSAVGPPRLMQARTSRFAAAEAATTPTIAPGPIEVHASITLTLEISD